MYIHDNLKYVIPEVKFKVEELGVQDFKNIYFSLMLNKENIWKLRDPEILKRFDFFNGTTRTLGYSAARMQYLAMVLLLRTELPKDVLPQILNNYFTLLFDLDMFVQRKFLEADCRDYYMQDKEMNKENKPPVTLEITPERQRKGVKAKLTHLFRK